MNGVKFGETLAYSDGGNPELSLSADLTSICWSKRVAVHYGTTASFCKTCLNEVDNSTVPFSCPSEYLCNFIMTYIKESVET